MAGYTGEMRRFLDSNPGLRSRSTRTIAFEDFVAPELAAIYRGLLAAAGFHLDPSAHESLDDACATMLRARAETFGNDRAVRTLVRRQGKPGSAAHSVLSLGGHAALALTTCRDCGVAAATFAQRCQACGSEHPALRWWHVPLVLAVAFALGQVL